ncbi:hypothetical protein WS63_01750 [Burkholderia stagnalis]|nr:hypothetical protein WS63_01750 [Burkholderia stagnalis]KWK23174.1 hypothetical protein WT77_17615 [Burkholderia stagnalis]
MNAAMPRICVVGAGAVGCYLGGRLAAAGAPVQLIGRARIGDAIRRSTPACARSCTTQRRRCCGRHGADALRAALAG